jgi:hypothetical protein
MVWARLAARDGELLERLHAMRDVPVATCAARCTDATQRGWEFDRVAHSSEEEYARFLAASSTEITRKYL